MVFLSRYVVGGVARNVQGNEHLALLPIPVQLPVVGAQEKEGREAGVKAHRGARPQHGPQPHCQEESPRRPATALHAAAARPARRSLIQFWRRRDGAAKADGGREEGGREQSCFESRAPPASSRETVAPKVTLGRGNAGPGLRTPGARCPPPLCAAAASARRPSARPGKAPASLHTFLKPRAPNPSPPHPAAFAAAAAAATRVPAAPPPPRASPRAPARPPPSLPPSAAPRAARGARLPGALGPRPG